MKLSHIAALALAGVLAASQAQAQITIINRPNAPASPGERGQRISINFQLSTPAPTLGAPSDWTKAIADASQALFEVVNRECDVLAATMKGDCRLVAISTGGNVNTRPNQFPGGNAAGLIAGSINVNANATFEIEPRAPQAVPPQQ